MNQNQNNIQPTDLETKRKTIADQIIKDGAFFKIFNVDVALLKFTDSKSRDIEDDEFLQLRESVKNDPDFLKVRFPFVNMYPGREWIIVGGDKRTKAAIAEGIKSIPVMFISVDPSKESAWNKKDNNHNGKWNEIELQKELITLRDSGYNMNSLSFTPTTLVDMMGKKIDPHAAAKTNPENKGTTPRKTKAKIGAQIECPNCHSHFAFAAEHDVEAKGESQNG